MSIEEPRRFNNQQRQALYLAADGKCQRCGEPLEAGWHADHVHPWSRDGVTDVVNGEALCPKCNLKKGANPMLGTWTKALLGWQARALDAYRAADSQDFLCEACPGAGKTIFGLRIAHQKLTEGLVDRVLVVGPTDHLKTQWTEKATGVGIDLDCNYKNSMASMEARDFHGMCVTYQQVCACKGELFRTHCARKRTFVIFDEIHHAGDESDWGKFLRHAFEHATARLELSGTPFKSDGQKIPFVSYDQEGYAIAGAKYSYAEAVEDGICRAVDFPSFEGDMEWSSDGEQYKAKFADTLIGSLSSQRLRTAIDPGTEYLPELLYRADEKLKEVRKSGHANAGALALAMDQNHADLIAELLWEITGERPMLVISDDEKSHGSIDEFDAGTRRWIVAVRMISEGVDIPRLRVLAYATNVMTDLFFRQAIGRIVRTVPGIDEQRAYCFIPADPELIRLSETLQDELRTRLDIEIEKILRTPPSGEPGPGGSFIPQSAIAHEAETISRGEKFSPDELHYAHELRVSSGLRTEETDIAKLLRVHANMTPGSMNGVPAHLQTTLADRKDKQRQKLRRLVGQLVKFRNGDRWPSAEVREQAHKEVYRDLMEIDGVNQAQCTEGQLEARIHKVAQWIKAAHA